MVQEEDRHQLKRMDFYKTKKTLSGSSTATHFLVGAFSLKEKSSTITVGSFFQLTISL